MKTLFLIFFILITINCQQTYQECANLCGEQKEQCGNHCDTQYIQLENCIYKNCQDFQGMNNECSQTCLSATSAKYQSLWQCYDQCETLNTGDQKLYYGKNEIISMNQFQNCLYQVCDVFMKHCYQGNICSMQANRFWRCYEICTDEQPWDELEIQTDKSCFTKCTRENLFDSTFDLAANHTVRIHSASLQDASTQRTLAEPLQKYFECNNECYARSEYSIHAPSFLQTQSILTENDKSRR